MIPIVSSQALPYPVHITGRGIDLQRVDGQQEILRADLAATYLAVFASLCKRGIMSMQVTHSFPSSRLPPSNGVSRPITSMQAIHGSPCSR